MLLSTRHLGELHSAACRNMKRFVSPQFYSFIACSSVLYTVETGFGNVRVHDPCLLIQSKQLITSMDVPGAFFCCDVLAVVFQTQSCRTSSFTTSPDRKLKKSQQ